MTPSEKVAHDMARALHEQNELDRRNQGPPEPNPFHGAGFGSLGDYAVFAGMVGAIIGAITGGVGGAIVWAVMLFAICRLPGFLRGHTGVDRGAVFRGIILGGVVGGICGLAFALGREVILGIDVPAEKAFNIIVNFAFFGAAGVGLYRTYRR